ncbi:MAG: hypothetical protein J6L82_08395 [Alphaproteobacteria bacterium]|nr:hypothetical protein [Alphaproteobacteria bacterium]
MKKLFLCFLSLIISGGCVSGMYSHPVAELSVSFMEPTDWNGKIFPANQGCRFQGGQGSTPALYVSRIPEQTNLLILEINNLDVPELAQNGGNGSIGFYHNGESTAVLLPVPGESYSLPSFAFKEKASRVNAAKPYPYMPPCLEKHQRYTATVKAVKRTGSFDKQQTDVLGIGEIDLGKY